MASLSSSEANLFPISASPRKGFFSKDTVPLAMAGFELNIDWDGYLKLFLEPVIELYGSED